MDRFNEGGPGEFEDLIKRLKEYELGIKGHTSHEPEDDDEAPYDDFEFIEEDYDEES